MPFRHLLKCETMPCTSEQFELMTLCKEVMTMSKVQNVLCMSLHGNQSFIEFKAKEIRRSLHNLYKHTVYPPETT